jgi:hypothetical protein
VSLRLAVDADTLLQDFLIAQSGVYAIVGARVYSAIPPKPTLPLVRYHRLGATDVFPGHLEAVAFQIDSWGRTKVEASALDRTVVAALRLARLVPQTLGIVTETLVTLAGLWQPDPDTNQARYISDVTLYMHVQPA